MSNPQPLETINITFEVIRDENGNQCCCSGYVPNHNVTFPFNHPGNPDIENRACAFLMVSKIDASHLYHCRKDNLPVNDSDIFPNFVVRPHEKCIVREHLQNKEDSENHIVRAFDKLIEECNEKAKKFREYGNAAAAIYYETMMLKHTETKQTIINMMKENMEHTS